MSRRRGSYYREAEFTLEVGLGARSKEIDVTVSYIVDDGEVAIDCVVYAVASRKFPKTVATYPLDWMVDDEDFHSILLEAVNQYETDAAEGYRDSEAEAKMEELRERRLDSAA